MSFPRRYAGTKTEVVPLLTKRLLSLADSKEPGYFVGDVAAVNPLSFRLCGFSDTSG